MSFFGKCCNVQETPLPAVALMAVVKRRCLLAKLNSKQPSNDAVPKQLTREEIEGELAELHGWKYEDGFVVKRFDFGRFLDGIRFVNRVAAVAEEREHHPDIQIRYTTVKLSLQTHSEGGVTRWDIELAAALDKLRTKGLAGVKRSK